MSSPPNFTPLPLVPSHPHTSSGHPDLHVDLQMPDGLGGYRNVGIDGITDPDMVSIGLIRQNPGLLQGLLGIAQK